MYYIIKVGNSYVSSYLYKTFLILTYHLIFYHTSIQFITTFWNYPTIKKFIIYILICNLFPRKKTCYNQTLNVNPGICTFILIIQTCIHFIAKPWFLIHHGLRSFSLFILFILKFFLYISILHSLTEWIVLSISLFKI